MKLKLELTLNPSWNPGIVMSRQTLVAQGLSTFVSQLLLGHSQFWIAVYVSCEPAQRWMLLSPRALQHTVFLLFSRYLTKLPPQFFTTQFEDTNVVNNNTWLFHLGKALTVSGSPRSFKGSLYIFKIFSSSYKKEKRLLVPKNLQSS